MPNIAILYDYLPDLALWARGMWQFCLDHLPWLLVAAFALGWLVHVLVLKHLLVSVLRTIWGWTKFLSWLAWMVLGHVAHLFTAAIKRMGHKAVVAFAHHKVVGVGVIIVALWVLHAYVPAYPEWGHVHYIFQMVFTSYVVIIAFVFLFKKVMTRRNRS